MSKKGSVIILFLDTFSKAILTANPSACHHCQQMHKLASFDHYSHKVSYASESQCEWEIL